MNFKTAEDFNFVSASSLSGIVIGNDILPERGVASLRGMDIAYLFEAWAFWYHVRRGISKMPDKFDVNLSDISHKELSTLDDLMADEFSNKKIDGYGGTGYFVNELFPEKEVDHTNYDDAFDLCPEIIEGTKYWRQGFESGDRLLFSKLLNMFDATLGFIQHSYLRWSGFYIPERPFGWGQVVEGSYVYDPPTLAENQFGLVSWYDSKSDNPEDTYREDYRVKATNVVLKFKASEYRHLDFLEDMFLCGICEVNVSRHGTPDDDVGETKWISRVLGKLVRKGDYYVCDMGLQPETIENLAETYFNFKMKRPAASLGGFVMEYITYSLETTSFGVFAYKFSPYIRWGAD